MRVLSIVLGFDVVLLRESGMLASNQFLLRTGELHFLSLFDLFISILKIFLLVAS